MKKHFLLLVMMLLPVVASAETIEKDGVYYNIAAGEKIAEVTSNPNGYFGSLIIPEKIEYEETEYCVTSIGDWAFSFCFNLTSIVISNSVTTIGNYAFSGCSSLTSVTIPCSVSAIGKGVFMNCSSLTTLTIPFGVTSIEQSAFCGCSSLTSVTIPRSVVNIGYEAFRDCYGLTSVQITDIEAWCNISFSYSSNPLIYAHHLFIDGEEVKNIVIPSSVTNISNFTFQNCSSLISVTIPSSVTTIGDGAFENCANLTSIIIPGGVTKIGDSAFSGCSRITSVSISGTVSIIGQSAFSGCNQLTELAISEGVTSIGAYAFRGCSALSTIEIPSSVYEIGENAFSQTQWYNDQPQGLVYAGNVLYCYKGEMPENYSIELKDGTTGIADNAFTNNGTNLVSITVPEGVKAIGRRAFAGCKLISLSLPNSITDIGYNAFQGCIDLTDINIPLGVTRLDGQIFYGCKSLKQIEIPAGVTIIGDQEFGECKNLTKLIIADSDSELTFVRGYGTSGKWGVSDCPLSSIYIGRNIKARYDYDYTTNFLYSPFGAKETITNLQFGDKVTEINREAFSYCSGLTSIELPRGIKTIDYAAFKGCENLSFINLPDSLTSLGARVFEECANLQSINIPKKMESIEGYVFAGSGLTSISIPSNITSIGERAFWDCKHLDDLRIEDDTTYLSIVRGDYASFYQNPITHIYLGRNISSYYSLFHTLSITNPFDLTISKSVTNLNGCIFAELNIKTLTFNEGSDTLYISYSDVGSLPTFYKTTVDSIYLGRTIISTKTRFSAVYPTVPFDESPFSMRIGNNIEEIGDYAYSGWKIDTLYIPKNVKTIGASPFNSCAYLHDVFIEDGDEPLEFNEGIGFYGIQLNNLYLGRNVSYPENCSPFSRNKEALRNLTLGSHVTEISDEQFVGCKNLTQIDFPKSLRIIGNQAFYGCEGLMSLSIPSNIEEIRKDAFNLCRGLTYVSIDDSEKSLAIDNNFMNCELKKVYLGRNIIYPEHMSPFSGLDYLDSLIIGNKVTEIGKSTFATCLNLKDVISYAEVVPETNEYAFTQSYLSNATLLVPYKLYDKYRVTIPWSLFGKIVNFEGLYNLTYFVDNDEYSHSVVEQGSEIIVEEEPEKEGYTFSGWSAIPEIMPDHDVLVTGSFTVNKYKITYMIDGEVFTTDYVEYGSVIVPPTVDGKEGYTFDGWMDVPETMPAHDITIYGSFTSGIAEISFEHTNDVKIYTVSGKRIDRLQRGVNIIRYSDGRVRKINVK